MKDTIKKIIDPQLPQVGRSLLNRQWDKKIDLQECDKECAYWMTQNLTDHKFVPYPPVPIQVLEYQDRKRSNPNYQVKEEYWRQEDITEYMKEWRHTSAKNSSNFYWLVFMQENIPKEDKINQARIADVLKDYTDDKQPIIDTLARMEKSRVRYENVQKKAAEKRKCIFNTEAFLAMTGR